MSGCEDIPPCPGCGKEWGGGTLQYTATSYKGEMRHYECAWEDDEEMKRVGDHERVRELLNTEDIARLREMVESGRNEEVIEVVDAARRPEGHGARYCPNCRAFAEWRPADYDYPERRLCAWCGQTFVDDPNT